MAFRERIEVVVDFATEGARSALGKLIPDLKAVDKAAADVGTTFEDTSTAGQRLAAGLSLVADELTVEFNGTRQAAASLSAALGPEMAERLGQSGVNNLVSDFRRAGLTFEDIEADAKELADAVRRLEDVGRQAAVGMSSVDDAARNAAAGMDSADAATRRVGATTDQTRSVVANFAGNAVQELPGIGAAMGPVNMAFGQFAEYASEGNIKLRNFVGAAAGLGVAAVVVMGISKHFQEIAETKAFNKAQVDDWVESLREGASAADAVLKSLEEAGKIEFRSLFNGTENLVPALARAGVTAQQFAVAVRDGEPGVQALGQAMRNAGVDVEDLNSIVYAATSSVENLEQAQRTAAEMAKVFDADNKVLGVSIDGTQQSTDALAEATKHAADQAEYYKSRAAAARGATEDLTGATDDGTTSTATYTSKIEALATALDVARQAEEDARNARKSLADLNIEIADKTDAYQDSLAELGGTLLDTESTTEDVETAQRNARDAAIDLAGTYAEQKIASGDARDSNTLMIESLGYMAATLEPNSPLRKQLEAYIEDLRGIPTNITTTVSVQYLNNGNGPMVDENGNLHTTGRRLAPDDGKGAGRPAMQADTALWDQGLAAMANQPSAADRKRQAFDREMEILKRKYEVGDITADEYLNALTRLGQKYKWKRLSDPWMALWRERERAKKDAREAAAEAVAADQGGDLTKAPGKGANADEPTVTKAPKMGAAPRMGGRSGSGAGVVINAIVMDRKDAEKLAAWMEPAMTKAQQRRGRSES